VGARDPHREDHGGLRLRSPGVRRPNGVANGDTTREDPSGVREGTSAEMYLACLRDPAGNTRCGLHRMPRA